MTDARNLNSDNRTPLMPMGRFAGRSFGFYFILGLVIQTTVAACVSALGFIAQYASPSGFTQVSFTQFAIRFPVAVLRDIPRCMLGLPGIKFIGIMYSLSLPTASFGLLFIGAWIVGILLLFAWLCRIRNKNPRRMILLFAVYSFLNAASWQIEYIQMVLRSIR